MKDWKRTLVSPKTSIRDTIRQITESALQIALVTNAENNLLGTVTDGDIRMGILKGLDLSEPVEKIMQRCPYVCRKGEGREAILATMKLKRLHHMPIVDDNEIIVGLELIDDLVGAPPRDNIAILMAGGLGSRLHPLTETCPKPLLQVGDRPILETILLNLIDNGIRRFYISVNYMAQMVMEHFGDGSNWGVEIRYLQEKQKLGTAGALSLLTERPESPILVMNADLLTKVNFGDLLDFHTMHHSKATMCVREYNHQIPYGVVKIDQHHFLGIKEKPVKRYFVNAGIYVLESEVIDNIPPDTYFDMPQLFESLQQQSPEIAVFPIREYWIDIGQMNDLIRATNDFRSEF
ncbi:MAG: nucleotidyltransferase family protein [Proteobacteria bacterium]|nr:nucleotidyltransferase family protein [Pseudomonadota bacterium]MBU1688665.1 nucleotidyltransferase family protein [Pseudomonadota bacterium]